MIAITTSSSIRVKPRRVRGRMIFPPSGTAADVTDLRHADLTTGKRKTEEYRFQGERGGVDPLGEDRSVLNVESAGSPDL